VSAQSEALQAIVMRLDGMICSGAGQPWSDSGADRSKHLSHIYS
jgi:hypothetical protein